MVTKTKPKQVSHTFRVYDLSKPDEWKALGGLSDTELEKIYAKSNMEKFAKGESGSMLIYEDAHILTDEYGDCTVIVKDGFIHIEDDSNPPHAKRYFNPSSGQNPFIKTADYKARFGRYGVSAVLCKGKSNVLANGDEEGMFGTSNHYNNGVTHHKENNTPTISFLCLSQFYKGETLETLKRIIKGEIVVLDFTVDETRAGNKKKQPEPGFTWMGETWHRSGTVLLHDTKHDHYILLGQDEGTYFGVELPTAAKTVKQAFNVLTPKEVKGQVFVRQGEWFLVPVDKADVPSYAESAFLFDMDGSNYLPVETDDSNKHFIETTDGRVGKDGQVYAYCPDLRHEQHKTVRMEGWCTFYKNTALRSHSQEGVD